MLPLGHRPKVSFHARMEEPRKNCPANRRTFSALCLVSSVFCPNLLASDGTAEDGFGDSVSISGDKTIVGAAADNRNAGSAYVFQKVCPTADLSGDCHVDFEDFAIVANQWLQGAE